MQRVEIETNVAKLGETFLLAVKVCSPRKQIGPEYLIFTDQTKCFVSYQLLNWMEDTCSLTAQR